MGKQRAYHVLALAGILFFMAQPAFAGCGEDQSDCPLIPPQTREIGNHAPSGSALIPVPDNLHSLAPLDVQPPPFVLQPDPVSAGSEAPPFVTLELPLRLQVPGDVTCGVQALGMALAGLGGSTPSSSALLAYLSGQGYLYEFGTGVEELAAAAGHFGYAGAYAFHDWSLGQLATELATGRPVVLALGTNGASQPGHFVTLNGISPDGAWFSIADPQQGELVLPAGEFNALWAAQGSSGVAVATSPPDPRQPGYETFLSAALAMMATLSLAPGMLKQRTRPGIGGALLDAPAAGSETASIALEPPGQAPAGMQWVRGSAVYETVSRTVVEYEEIPNLVYKQVQVGTRIEQVPYTTTIEVDEGQWVTDYRTERYISRYRTKKVLLYYRQKRYVAGYRSKRVPLPGGGFTYQQVPIYAYRQEPVYGQEQVPVYSTRQVEAGRHWESNWVTYEYTDYKAVEQPVYEWQWVQEGVQRVPVQRQVEEQVLVGYEWRLVESQAEDPLPVERSGQDLDVVALQRELSRLTKSELLERLLQGSEAAANGAFLATSPLNVRQDPDAGSPRLAVATPGELLLWTGGGAGAVLADGSREWLQVIYYDRYKGQVQGWIKQDYVQRYEPQAAAAGSLAPDMQSLLREALLREWEALGPVMQAEILQQAKLAFDRMEAELRALFEARVPTHDPVYEGILEQALAQLLEVPTWYLEDSVPSSFLGEYQLTLEAIEVLRAIAPLVSDDATNGLDDIWQVLAAGLNISASDALLAATNPLPWSEHAPGTAGDFPVVLWVNDRAGASLRLEPRWDSACVAAPFNGIPFWSQGGTYETCVTWDGRYHLGTDENGTPCTYYYVTYCWKPNGQTYSGWVVADYFTPQYTATGTSSAILRDYGFNTLGFGQGSAGWEQYWAGGAAQNLNLSLLFKLMGDPDFAQYATKHTNLCGILAVMEALGVSLEEGFERFKELGQEFVNVLKDPGKGTDVNHLEGFVNSFSDYGWEAYVASVSIRALPDLLDKNNKVMALVTIDTTAGAGGVISDTGNASHWVHVIGVEDGVVRYYDPYSNCERTMDVREFERAWANTPGNAGTFTAVIGSR